MLIRPYQPADRQAVRTICCDTADAGEPVENFFHDRELIADLVTRYYTDFDRQSSWVAESAGQVIGYLNGCLDTRRFIRVETWRIAPPAILGAVWRGALFRHQTWRWFRAMWRTWRIGGARRDDLFRSYPAHLHVNVRSGFRGERVGERLVEKFFEQATTAQVPGIHASVRGDNAPGCRFFERMGFTEIARYPMILPKNNDWLETHTVIYGKTM